MNKIVAVAKSFGNFLDKDNFIEVRKLVDKECVYKINSKTCSGVEDIVGLYENNMKQARAKLDKLVWGKNKVKKIDEVTAEIVFTDYLTHKNKKHVYQCAQIIKINNKGLIIEIIHQDLSGEKEKLDNYYKDVGLT